MRIIHTRPRIVGHRGVRANKHAMANDRFIGDERPVLNADTLTELTVLPHIGISAHHTACAERRPFTDCRPWVYLWVRHTYPMYPTQMEDLGGALPPAGLNAIIIVQASAAVTPVNVNVAAIEPDDGCS